MIESWAERLAIMIKKSNENETVSVPVMKFAITIVINFFIPYVSAIIIGMISGKTLETIIAVHAFVLIRLISGGFHFRSAITCIIVSTLVVVIPPHIVLPTDWIYYINAFSLLLFVIFAPANIKGYARMPEKYFPLLKVASIIVVSSNFLFVSSVLSLIFLIQSISLLIPNKKEVTS